MISIVRVLCYSFLFLFLDLMLACNSDKVNVLPIQIEQLSQADIVNSNDSLVMDSMVPTLNEDSVLKPNLNSLPAVEVKEDGDYAYGQLKFGMTPKQVKDLNAGKQKLVNYFYHFSYAFNDKDELYAVYLRSEAEIALYYESRLQSKYSNLCRIIAEKYGNKGKCGTLASIFEVMNNKTLYLAQWRLENKKIQLGITQDQLNAYRVLCKISNPDMEEAARRSNYLKKNKKLIDASEKF